MPAPTIASTSRTRNNSKPQSVTLTLECNNSSSLQRIPRQRIQRALELCLAYHKRAEGTVSIVFLDDTAMRRLNKKFLGHDYTTDVITFALDEDTVDGELYIGAQTAKRQAGEYGVSTENEIVRLAIHGLLHLLGFDDATPALRQRMHEEENRILTMLYGNNALH